MNFMTYLIAQIEDGLDKNTRYEALNREQQYEFVQQKINELSNFELVEWMAYYDAYLLQVVKLDPKSWEAVTNLAAAIGRLQGPDDAHAKPLLAAFRDLLVTLKLD